MKQKLPHVYMLLVLTIPISFQCFLFWYGAPWCFNLIDTCFLFILPIYITHSLIKALDLISDLAYLIIINIYDIAFSLEKNQL